MDRMDGNEFFRLASQVKNGVGLKAVSKRPFTVHSCNAKSPHGATLRKDRHFTVGDRFTVKEFFVSNGLALHGEKCVWIEDSKGYRYATFASHFDFHKA